MFQMRLAPCIAVIPLLYPCSRRSRSCTNIGNADASQNGLLYAVNLLLLAICIRREYLTIGQAQTGSEDYVELCQWYDADQGLQYSLSVYTTDVDGLDLAAVAEQVYKK